MLSRADQQSFAGEHVVGSHALLLQLTTNLVHNAIVHNLPEQGTVWVTTSVHPQSAVLTVENTGEKLTPQLVDTLAEPFQRGSKRIRTEHADSGVGLGLAIVKRITQAHDGTLTLAARDGGGLRVTVHLPAAPSEPIVKPEIQYSSLMIAVVATYCS